MAGFKETPRQKMIGMMYLVLTALLALNVSKDIINAFVTVNESMEQTNENFEKKLSETYTNFEKQSLIGGPVAQDWYNKALEAKKLSDDLAKYLKDLKTELILFSDRNIENKAVADTISLRYVSAKDNFDDPTRFFLGTDVTKGRAEEMKVKFKEFREKIVQLVKPEDRDKLRLTGLDTDGKYKDEYGKEMSWEKYYFYHTILAADLVILNKYIAEVKNIEYDVVARLYSYISATDFKFNKIAAKVIPTRKYLFKGEEYQAEILVAAYDTTTTPNVKYRLGIDKWQPGYSAGASVVSNVQDGLALLKIGTGGMDFGPKKFAGVITITNPMGIPEEYEFADEFVVQEPVAVVSADKMSVFYIGLDNPLSVSVPGVPPDKISVKITGPATFTQKGGGKYEIKPTGTGTVKVSVYSTVDKGEKLMGERTFRLLPVPEPMIVVGGKTAGQNISITDLQNARVDAILKDFLFDGVRFTVTRFEVLASIGGLTQSVQVLGNTMDGPARNLIAKLGAKQMLIIGNIFVKGPDGKERPVSSAVNLKTL
ncbi:MAG: gliding motility protein GldM [Bacteroidales bacterium]|jgi:gliding motility-associated protein GldM|nr:gliding motility protein GldM [Bacteroidales bacterium]NPV36070.1 gliding motility protein GldM [Bacteroidales bacterium]